MRNWVPSLQSLRGLAAVAVVAFHVDALLVLHGQKALLGAVGAYGWLGVDLFFVLSAYLLGPRFFTEAPPSKRRFWLERFLRIGPAYYAAAAVAVVVALVRDAPGFNPWLAATNLVFLQNLRPETWATLNVVFWTLAVEVHFYLILPWMARRFRGPRWPAWLVAFLAMSLAFRFATFGHGDGRPFGDGDPWLFFGAATLPGFIGHFALGLAAARAQEVRKPGLWAGFGLVLVALLAFSIVPDRWATLLPPSGTEHVLLRPLAAAGFAMVVLGCTSPGRLRRVLELRPLLRLGDVSFCVYLLHFPVLVVLFDALNGTVHPWRFAALGFAASLLAGTLLYILVERPAERWRKAWMDRRRASVSA